MSADPAFTGQRPLLAELQSHLENNEKVRWASRPDVYSVAISKGGLGFVGIAWLGLTLLVYFLGWIGTGVLFPVALVGGAFLLSPFVLLMESDRTIYAITNRRALIVHNGMKHEVVSVPFVQMDDELEVLETRRGAGHIYFQSNRSTRMRDVDYTGKLAFRDVGRARDIAKILDAARGR